MVRIPRGDGRDADARRLDDVDGVDADARTDVARKQTTRTPCAPSSAVSVRESPSTAAHATTKPLVMAISRIDNNLVENAIRPIHGLIK